MAIGASRASLSMYAQARRRQGAVQRPMSSPVPPLESCSVVPRAVAGILLSKHARASVAEPGTGPRGPFATGATAVEMRFVAAACARYVCVSEGIIIIMAGVFMCEVGT